ncbi:MAG: thioredoxin domain-containing protein [Candidatus Saccharibacteria bacterium]|nr:thioredoxin domain-containing protein [Candidatus Saccharibacteria bacterium]
MNNKIFIFLIALIVILFLGFVILGDNQDAPTVSQRSDNTYGVSPQNIVLEEAYSLGCPACAQHHPVLKPLRQEFQDKIIFQPVHFPLTASFRNALAAHRAVEAARQQSLDLFWALHDKLFEEREAWVNLDDPIDQIRVFAEEAGVDLEQFDVDFKSSKINDIINNDIKYVESLGITGTPTFILDGQVLEEADDEAFSRIETAREFINQYLENLETASAAEDNEADIETSSPSSEEVESDNAETQ